MTTFRPILTLASVATLLLLSLLLTLRPVQAQATLLLRLYHDRNQDGQAQPGEPIPGHAYSLAWSDGQHRLSSTGRTDPAGYVQATTFITGAWTLQSDCLTYTFVITGVVAGQPVTDLPVCPTYSLYMPVVRQGAAQ